MMTATRTRIIDHDAARVGQWMAQQGSGHYRAGETAIGLEREGLLVAGTSYDCCNGASVFCSIAITGPITREWLWYIFYYPFMQLGVKVLLGLVDHDNQKSHRLVRHLGFTEVEELHDAHPTGSLTLYRMNRENCRFLQRKAHV